MTSNVPLRAEPRFTLGTWYHYHRLLVSHRTGEKPYNMRAGLRIEVNNCSIHQLPMDALFASEVVW